MFGEIMRLIKTSSATEKEKQVMLLELGIIVVKLKKKKVNFNALGWKMLRGIGWGLIFFVEVFIIVYMFLSNI